MTKLHSQLGECLFRIGFPTVLDAARTACAHQYEAWIEAKLPNNISETPAGALIAPIHQDGTCKLSAVTNVKGVVDQLHGAGIVAIDGDTVSGGKWQLTAYKGIIAARDRAPAGSDSKVYVGEDSLHFVDWIASSPKGKSALDIGAGSGISSVALARRAEKVIAVDIDPDCCEAIPLTAGLNGASEQIQPVLADATKGLTFSGRFDIVVGNTPGVPIPTHINYSPAGRGGEDGLSVSKSVLDQLPQLLSTSGTALLKFESAGGDIFPKSEQILREMAKENGWSVLFIQHSRIPMEVRSAISTRWAGPLNESHSTRSLLTEFDKHAQRIGATQFYTCTAQISADGDGRLTSLPVYGYGNWLINGDARALVSRKSAVSDGSLTEAYLERIRTLPDGMWELDVRKYLFAPLTKAMELVETQRQASSFGAAVRAVFEKEMEADPVHARSLYVLSAILLESFLAAQ